MKARWEKLERAIVAACALLVAGLVAALVWLDLGRGHDGARIEARLLTAEVGPAATVVGYEVRNEGDAPVTDVQVRVAVPGEEVEQSFTHLPAGARRRGTAVFHEGGRKQAPTVRVVGYLEP